MGIRLTTANMLSRRHGVEIERVIELADETMKWMRFIDYDMEHDEIHGADRDFNLWKVQLSPQETKVVEVLEGSYVMSLLQAMVVGHQLEEVSHEVERLLRGGTPGYVPPDPRMKE